METGTDITGLFTKPKIPLDQIKTPDNPAPAETPQTQPEQNENDHIITKFCDFALKISAPICEKNGIEPPAADTYETFARDAINEAAWEFLPDIGGEAEETPRWLIAVLAAVGIILVCLPTVLSLIAKHAEQTAAELLETEQPELEETTTQPTNISDPTPTEMTQTTYPIDTSNATIAPPAVPTALIGL